MTEDRPPCTRCGGPMTKMKMSTFVTPDKLDWVWVCICCDIDTVHAVDACPHKAKEMKQVAE